MTETKTEIKKDGKNITVKGARLHNLRNISVEIPRNRLTVITGVSGSGKSTLAFDTIYAEGQRRFVQSLSAYARQFLERMGKPDVDAIAGLPPAIAIEQKPPSKNPRSTVGTSTEIYDYLRLLFGRVGTTYCRNCGNQVRKDSPQTIVRELKKWKDGEKIYIMFPLPEQTRNVKEAIEDYKKLGFFRVITKDSENFIDTEQEAVPDGLRAEDVMILADRLVIRKDEESLSRINESIETAMKYGEGRVAIRNLGKRQDHYYSARFECAECGILYLEPEPKLFSFNNPYGACPSCQGFGRTIGIDIDLILPDKSRTLRKGAVHPFRTQRFSHLQRNLIKVAERKGIPVDVPVHSLSEGDIEFIMKGTDEYIGIEGFYKLLEEKSYKVQYRVMMSRYRGYTTCNSCGGSRLRTSSRQVFIGGKNIPQIIKIPLDKLLDYVQNLKLDTNQDKVAGQVLREIRWRLQLLVDIGLEYLTLDRLSHTLSGGEAQRINLSTALGSSLVGTLYVLDEPSVGMHPRDINRLMRIMFKLRNLGNTIIIVEHEPQIIEKADHIIDLGPGAGEFGGHLTYSGNMENIVKNGKSLTGQYLSGEKKLEIPKKKKLNLKKKLTIHGARQHNLKIESVDFPLNSMTVVSGVSGSGKSTLVHNVLYAGLKKFRGGYSGAVGKFEKIEGSDDIEQIELVDQSPIGKSRRSTPATYTKVFDFIRELFAQAPEARQLGFKPGYFSFNVPGGRCDVCDGEGYVTVDMQFLPDVSLECEACKGTRYKKEVRNILYKGQSIIDVLNMTVDEAMKLFENSNQIKKKLQILHDVGLGYLRLGQPSTMLSGGESQRIKLASHLEARSQADSLFIFDEPTTGLHLDDISKLLDCFRQLVNMGHTVIIIEHNIHVVASADWVIDLGPDAGESGGEVVAIGPPEEVAKKKDSHTGNALKKFYAENK